jgi:hypothetical protein
MNAAPAIAMRALVMLVVAALWLGAAAIVAAVVAPAAFAVLPSRGLAGALVGRVLPVVFLSGCVAGAAVLTLDLSDPTRTGAAARVTAAIAWIAACAIAQFIVTPRIERLRLAAGGSIDSQAVDAPLRIAFGRLHGVSVGLLGLAMLAAITVVALAAAAAGRKG